MTIASFEWIIQELFKSDRLLVAIIKKRLKSEASLYTILQILSLTLFDKTPLIQLLTETPLASEDLAMANQLNLFEK